ncbi:hypothetical protein HACA111877_13830 [Halomonas casei]
MLDMEWHSEFGHLIREANMHQETNSWQWATRPKRNFRTGILAKASGMQRKKSD